MKLPDSPKEFLFDGFVLWRTAQAESEADFGSFFAEQEDQLGVCLGAVRHACDGERE
jgi:hypothetical protein